LTLSAADAKAFGAAVGRARSPSLRSLNLSYNSRRPPTESGGRLAALLAAPALESLDLSANWLSGELADQGLAEAALARHASLARLHLRKCGLTGDDAQSLWRGVEGNAAAGGALAAIDLTRTAFGTMHGRMPPGSLTALFDSPGGGDRETRKKLAQVPPSRDKLESAGVLVPLLCAPPPPPPGALGAGLATLTLGSNVLDWGLLAQVLGASGPGPVERAVARRGGVAAAPRRSAAPSARPCPSLTALNLEGSQGFPGPWLRLVEAACANPRLRVLGLSGTWTSTAPCLRDGKPLGHQYHRYHGDEHARADWLEGVLGKDDAGLEAMYQAAARDVEFGKEAYAAHGPGKARRERRDAMYAQQKAATEEARRCVRDAVGCVLRELLVPILAGAQALTDLDVSDNALDGEGLVDAVAEGLRENRSLRTLTLARVYGLSAGALLAIFAALSKGAGGGAGEGAAPAGAGQTLGRAASAPTDAAGTHPSLRAVNFWRDHSDEAGAEEEWLRRTYPPASDAAARKDTLAHKIRSPWEYKDSRFHRRVTHETGDPGKLLGDEAFDSDENYY